MKPGYFVGGLVIFFCIVVTAMALSGAVRRTVTFAEAMESKQPCEVYGKVLKHTLSFDEQGRFTFQLAELDKDHNPTNQRIKVVSLKPKPANFDQAEDVKAIGVVKDGVFNAQDMLIKCPSKYITSEKKPGGYGSETPATTKPTPDLKAFERS